MKKTITKITFLLMTLIVLLTACQIPVMAETTPEKIIYKDDNGNYLVYYKEYCNGEFGYAIVTTSDTGTEPTILKGSSKDGSEENLNVVFIPASQVTDPETYEGYAWITTDDTTFVVKADKIDLTEAIDSAMMEEVNKENIKTKTDGQYETQKVEDGVTKTVKLGKVDVLDDGDYEYILIKVESGSKEEELYNLALKMEEEVDGTYAKLEANKQFCDYYNKLKSQSSGWSKVENKEILQPDSANKGDKYLVALREKVDGEVTAVEAKFFVSDYEYTPEYKTDDKIITEVVGLPITYDSIALIVIFAVIIIAIIILAILRKKSQNKNN